MQLFREISSEEQCQHLKNLQIYGYSKIEKLLPSEVVDRVRDRLDVWYEKTKDIPYAGRPTRDVNDKIVYNLHAKDKLFIELLGCDSLKEILKQKLNDPFYRFLPENVPNYVLAYFNARSSGKELDLHIDSWLPATGSNTWMMQVAFILEDQNEDNGCTIIAPGSHLSGQYTDRDLQNLQEVHSKKGDVVMWDSRLWHGTRANKSAGTRWSLIATLTSWWVKPMMDVTRSVSEELYSSLSDEQKALLGFCSIPPDSEFERINTKCGYEYLKPSVADYYAKRD